MDSSRTGSRITIPVCHVSLLRSSVSGVLDIFDTCDSLWSMMISWSYYWWCCNGKLLEQKKGIIASAMGQSWAFECLMSTMKDISTIKFSRVTNISAGTQEDCGCLFVASITVRRPMRRSNQRCFNPVAVSTCCPNHQLTWSAFPGATWLPDWSWSWVEACGRELHFRCLGGCYCIMIQPRQIP
jgi:hypothetical protein